MGCNDSDNNSSCLNGGTCMQRNGHEKSACSCTYEWTGDNCALRLIDQSLFSAHQFSLTRASLFAGLCVLSVLLLVGGFMLIVYVRYRRKHRLYADHLFKATAEELYRRPFNGRSSVVESLSRISSLRRTAASDGKDEPSTTDGLEISVKAEYIHAAEDVERNGNRLNADDDSSHKASEITESNPTPN